MLLAVGMEWWGLVKSSRMDSVAYTDRYRLRCYDDHSTDFWEIVLFFVPHGMAQVAWQDMSTSISIRELRFFGLEHPLQMIIAVGVTHLGQARSRKATETLKKIPLGSDLFMRWQ